MRILIGNIAAAPERSEAGRFIKTVLATVTGRALQLAAPPGTEFVFRFASDGERVAAFADCRHLSVVNVEAVPAALLHAQAEGFDGVIVGCFGDPFLLAIRNELGIPVAGFGESALLLALTMGRRIGLVSPTEELNERIRAQIDSYGLGACIAGIVATSETGAQQEIGLIDAGITIETFCQAARKLIAMGADVLIPACGLMSPPLRLALGKEKDYPQGLIAVDGVPVIDIVSAAMLQLNALLHNKQRGGAWKPRVTATTWNVQREAEYWDCVALL